MDHSIQTIQEDDERLWDELNHHQNTELIRHYSTNNNNNGNHNNRRSRQNFQNHTHTNRPLPLLTPPQQQQQNRRISTPSFYQQVQDDVQRVTSIMTNAAHEAYSYSYNNNDNSGGGTSRGGRFPRQQQQEQEHHYYYLDENGGDHPLQNELLLPQEQSNDIHHHHPYRSMLWRRWWWKSSSSSLLYSRGGRQHRYLNQNNNNNNNAYLADEFGIPDLDDDQYHNQQQQQHRNNNPWDHDNCNHHHTHSNSNNTEYIHLPPTTDLRSFPLPENDGWASISDLDVYFKSLYHYYYHRGYVPILTRGIIELITIYFTFMFSIVLFIYIDWKQLSTCIDESTCQSNFLQHYIHQHPFQHFWSIYNVWILLYIIIFGIYCFISLLSFIHTIQIAQYTKNIYEDKLGIPSRKLLHGAIDWDRDIVTKLIALQESGQYRIVIPIIPSYKTLHTQQNDMNHTTTTTTVPNRPSTTDTVVTDIISDAAFATTATNGDIATTPTTTDITSQNVGPNHHPPSISSTSTTNNTPLSSSSHNISALMIANRILRKENFMIYLFNRQVLNLSLKSYTNHCSYPSSTPQFFCSSLEWCIYYCVLNFMFNHKYQIRPAFYLDPAALRRRFQICGIIHAVMMPFLLFFITLYFGLRNVYDWKSTKQYLGPREWSISAKWLFREFNELPHFFERRLAPSYDAAETYVDLFGSNEFITAFGHICVFIGGSLGAFVLALAAMNDAILLHVKIGDWNLLWYGGMFGVLYSAGKAMIPKAIAQPKSARNLYAEMDTALAGVAHHTHYYPEIWINRGWDYATYSAFSSMFQYKVRMFLNEVISMILAPYVLYVSLADCAEAICELVLTCRAEIPGVGDVCGFATFDFSAFQDDTATVEPIAANPTTTQVGETLAHPEEPIIAMGQSLSASIMQTSNVEESIRQFPKPRTRHEKMRKSYVTFQEAHPSWIPVSDSSSVIPVERGKERPNDKTTSSALLHEQDIHHNAAARQLEVLERISSDPVNENDLLLLPNIIDESYIHRATP